MSNKKYVLTDEVMNYGGRTLHRIKAIKDFNDVQKGDLGGWIEKEINLSDVGDCWVYDNSKVFNNARVYGNAILTQEAEVYNNAEIFGRAVVCGARVFENAKIYGTSYVTDKAEVRDYAQIFGSSTVGDKAIIGGKAKIFGYARICDRAKVYGHAKVHSSSKVFGEAVVYGHANIFGDAHINDSIISENDYITINNIGDHSTITFINSAMGIRVNYEDFSGTIDDFKDFIKSKYGNHTKELLNSKLNSMNLSISEIPDYYDDYIDTTIKYVEKMFSKHKEDSLEYKVQEAINAIGDLLNYNLSLNNKFDKYLTDSLETSQTKLINIYDALTTPNHTAEWENLDYVKFSDIHNREYFSLNNSIFIKISDKEAVCITTGETAIFSESRYVNRVKSFSVE